MPTHDAYGPRKAMEVREDTWGHLAPKPRRVHKGTILLAESEYVGVGRTVIRTDFPGLEDSPWFYDGLTDFVSNLDGIENGKVYLWTGTYRFLKGAKPPGRYRSNYLDEGRHEFTGTVVLLNV